MAKELYVSAAEAISFFRESPIYPSVVAAALVCQISSLFLIFPLIIFADFA
jgi:hypothetical protein